MQQQALTSRCRLSSLRQEDLRKATEQKTSSSERNGTTNRMFCCVSQLPPPLHPFDRSASLPLIRSDLWSDAKKALALGTLSFKISSSLSVAMRGRRAEPSRAEPSRGEATSGGTDEFFPTGLFQYCVLCSALPTPLEFKLDGIKSHINTDYCGFMLPN